nr:PEP-CTERM sorting domain-containing protein [Microcystis aeruginosa]
MDGLEYFNGKLISNRCDACGVYDIYDTNGNLLQAAFITAPAAATGIAHDGTDFYVSNVYNSSIGVYDGVLGTLKSTINLIPKTPGDTFLIEALSVDYLQRPDTGRVPEPASVLGLLAIGVLGAGSALTRKLLK